MTVDELILDATELKNLLGKATRPNVKRALELELKKVEQQVAKSEKVAAAPAPQKMAPTTTSTILPEIKITNYGWDESEKFVKLYITLDNVHELPAENVKSEFTENSFNFNVKNLNGKNYSMAVKDLRSKIVAADSVIKQKTNTLLVMLRKADKTTWGSLTKTEFLEKEKNAPKFDEKEDPQASLMKMMKQMYDDGDDETKRSIKKAWHEGQSKKTGIDSL